MSAPPWHVRPYAPGDAPGVTALFEACFGRPQSVAQYHWKIHQAPCVVGAPTAWLGVADDRVIGQYAGTPMRFKLGDTERLILHGCDVMTAADYRGQGVLTQVGQAATEAWRAAGVAFITAMQYGGWGTRRHFLGWREMFRAIWLWRPLHPERLLARRYRLPSPLLGPPALAGRLWHAAWDLPLRRRAAGVRVEAVERPGSEFDTLWQRLHPAYEALAVRDRAWVTYRYTDAPDYGYRLLLARRGDQPTGYLAYRLTGQPTRTTGWLLDLFTHPTDSASRAALLRAALHAMDAAGAGSARVLVPAGTPLVSCFRQAGFVRARGEYDVSLVPLAADMPHPALHDPLRWFTMAGDYDVV